MIEGTAQLWQVVLEQGIYVLKLNAGKVIRLPYKGDISQENVCGILDTLEKGALNCDQTWRDDLRLELSLMRWLNQYEKEGARVLQ